MAKASLTPRPRRGVASGRGDRRTRGLTWTLRFSPEAIPHLPGGTPIL